MLRAEYDQVGVRLVRDADRFIGRVTGGDHVAVAAAGADVWVDPGEEFAFDVRGLVAGSVTWTIEELGIEGRGEGAGLFERDARDLGEVTGQRIFPIDGTASGGCRARSGGVVDDFLGH